MVVKSAFHAIALSEFACLSPKAVRITRGSVPEDEEDRHHVEKAPEEFEINMLRCIYCGYCQEVCPEEAIFLYRRSIPLRVTPGKK